MANGRLRFTRDAQRAIYEFSEGIPRLINQVCDRVLIRGYLQKTTTIRRDMVEAGVTELSGPSQRWGDTEIREVSGE